MKTVRPAVRLGRGVFPTQQCRVAERQHVVLLCFPIEHRLQLLDLVRHLRREVIELGGVFLDVVKLPLVRADVRRRRGAQHPWLGHRRRRRHPTLVIDGAIAEHLEILRGALARGVGVGLVQGVQHAHPFDRALLDAVDDFGLRDAGCFENGRHDVDDVVELTADAALVVDMAGPGYRHALLGTPEMRRHLFHPLERRVHRPCPGRRKMRERLVRSPERVPEILGLHRHRDAIEGGEFVRRTVEHAFRARTVVAADVDNQRVVELPHILDRLDDPADLVVGVGEVSPIDIRLPDEELLFQFANRIPFRKFFRPWRQLGVVRHDAEPLLVGEDGLAQLVPALVEQVHVADLLDPLRRRVMRRVRAARDVVDKERLFGRDLLERLHVLDGFTGHCRCQIPTWIVLEGIDRRRIAIEVGLPLAGVAADESVKIFEAHAIWPLFKRPDLARLVGRRVVVFAEPRGCVAVRLEDGADGAFVDWDDGILTRITRRYFADHAGTDRMMVAAGDYSCAGRRAERGGMEVV